MLGKAPLGSGSDPLAAARAVQRELLRVITFPPIALRLGGFQPPSAWASPVREGITKWKVVAGSIPPS